MRDAPPPRLWPIMAMNVVLCSAICAPIIFFAPGPQWAVSLGASLAAFVISIVVVNVRWAIWRRRHPRIPWDHARATHR